MSATHISTIPKAPVCKTPVKGIPGRGNPRIFHRVRYPMCHLPDVATHEVNQTNMYIYIYIHMYMCMYVCMYVCMHACMYVCMYVCMHACMYVRMYVCMCIYIYIHTYMDTYIYIYIHIHVCIHVCIYIYIYTCICTCIYVCIYIYTYSNHIFLARFLVCRVWKVPRLVTSWKLVGHHRKVTLTIAWL